MRPSSRFDRFSMWVLFVLPAATGTLVWVQRDRFGEEFAYLAWGCALLMALQIITDHYRTPPKDR